MPHWVAPLAAGVLSFGLQLPFFDRWFSHVDEGHMLLFADIVNRGGELYRDASVYPLPGAFHLLALAFQVFGTSALVARWIVLVEFALFSAIVVALLQRAVRPGLVWLGFALLLLYRIWCFPHWQAYNYSTTALVLLAGSLLLMLVAMERGSRSWLVGAGLLAGLATACKQDYGGAAILAMSAQLALARTGAEAFDAGSGWAKRLLYFVVPAAAVGLLIAIYYASHGLLGELLLHTVLGHLGGMAAFEYPAMPPLFPLFQQSEALRTPESVFTYGPGLLNTVALDSFRDHTLFRTGTFWEIALKSCYYGPYALCAVAALALWMRRGRIEAPRATAARVAHAATAGAFLVVITLNRPQDYVHIAVLYWPFIAVALYLVDVLVERLGRAWPVLLPLCAGVAVAAAPSVSLFWELRTQHSERIELERGRIYVRPHEARTLEALVDYIHERVPPGHRVAAMPYFPIGLFLADRIGPHRSSYVMWPVSDIPFRDRAISSAMESQQVDTVIWNWTQVVNFPPVAEYAPGLYRYLVDNFEIDRVFSNARWGYLIGGLERSPPRALSRTLFRGPDDVGAMWIETKEGDRWPAGTDQWGELMGVDLWPFRRAVTLRPSANGGRTVLSIPVGTRLPGSQLETAVMVHPNRWSEYPANFVAFQLRIVDDAENRTVVFERTLDPNRELEDRRWVDVRVPLDPYAGKDISVELAVEIERVEAELLGWAAWELPRVTLGPPRAP